MITFVNAMIFHARVRPKPNRFAYRVPYLAIPAFDFATATGSGLFSIDAPNLFGLRRRDYGDDPLSLVRELLERHELPAAGGDIVLLTIPRLFGYVFNPVSFWFCFDRQKGLSAVLAQVNNTFGERHSYLCFRDDRKPIEAGDVVRSEKVFHVSPFIEVKGHYRFSFDVSDEQIAVKIDHHDDDGLLLTTSLSGRRQPLKDLHLVAAFLGNPLLMLKVIGLIHYQAVKLFLKGVKHYHKPSPPNVQISR